MQNRFERYTQLVSAGALRAADHDSLREDILDLDASIRSERAEVLALRNQASQAELQVVADALDLRQRLLDRQSQVSEAIPRVKTQILKLDALINSADLRAPTDGTISQLRFPTDTMYIPRGETILTLTRPTETHRVSFLVPPHAIDQTRVGMSGTLTVSSLPQRNHPKIKVVIQSLSPEAKRSPDGAILGYVGVASINPEDLASLQTELGPDLTLAIDMPVTLVFVGRQTTFAGYLVGPFLEFLAKAMQD